MSVSEGSTCPSPILPGLILVWVIVLLRTLSNMARVIRAMGLLALVVLSTLALATNAQLDPDRSFFLLNGASPGGLTVVSLSLQSHNLPLPPSTPSIPVQSLTDIANGRFVVLSGEDLGAAGVNFTVRLRYLECLPSKSFLSPHELYLLLRACGIEELTSCLSSSFPPSPTPR